MPLTREERNARRRVANMTPEQREERNKRQRERWAKMTPERRERALERQRESRAKMTPEQREKKNAGQRERWAKMTPEQREEQREQQKKRQRRLWAKMTPEQREERNKRRRVANMTPEQREERKARQRVANMTPEQREERNKHRNEHKKKRWKEDINYRLTHLLRSRILRALKSQNAKKCAKTMDLIGTSIVRFRAHLESHFNEGMSWENQGKEWHMDHMMPCAMFDQQKEQHMCHHWTNFRPEWATENMSLGHKIKWDMEWVNGKWVNHGPIQPVPADRTTFIVLQCIQDQIKRIL